MPARFRSTTLVSFVLAAATALALTACAAPEAESSLVIGYLGPLTGRSAALGLAGRDGTLLAVEQVNAAGGVEGRSVELHVADDASSESAPQTGVRHLVDDGAEIVIGPLTSSSAQLAVSLADELRVPLLSPTVSSTDFSGRDDYFLRTCADNRAYARSLFEYAFGDRVSPVRASAVYDAGNASYTARLVEHFRDAVVEGGGAVSEESTFVSGENPDYTKLARQAMSDQPDCVFVVANAIDSAMVCQQLRKMGYRGPVLFAHWAVTDDLISSGGDAVDGTVFMDNYERDSKDPDYVAMREAFVSRFGYEPSFAAIHAYDATRMALAAAELRSEGESAKQALLRLRRWPGVQGVIVLDEFGDTARPFYPMTVRDGRFVPAPETDS